MIACIRQSLSSSCSIRLKQMIRIGRIDGIDEDSLALLEAAGFQNAASLARITPIALQQELAGANRLLRIVASVPEPSILRQVARSEQKKRRYRRQGDDQHQQQCSPCAEINSHRGPVQNAAHIPARSRIAPLVGFLARCSKQLKVINIIGLRFNCGR